MPSHKIQNKQIQNQKTLKNSLKENLLKWICEKHATNSPLNRKLLRNKALQISQALDLTNFKCSEQWLTTFLKKYGFSTTLTNCVGPCFKDYRLWVDLMRTVLTQYRYKDLFHVDELTMYSDIMPLKFNSTSLENTQDSQIINAMNLISILFCCNASGTDKLPPLISGPYKSNIFREDFRYCYNENSLINDEVFADWLSSLNRIMFQQNRKILLLLHRHRIQALGNTQLSNVNLIFFPADFPSHLRPLRRDVFRSAKMKYRLRYADKILKPDSKWGLEEMIDAVLKSWREVPRELIVSSFQRTTFRSDDSLLEISCTDWEKLKTGISFKRLVTFDDYLSDVPNSLSNKTKQLMNGRHNYNLRTSFQEILQIEESDDILKLKDALKEQHCLKSEINLVTLTSREETELSRSIEGKNADLILTDEQNSHQEENLSIGLDQEENNEHSVSAEESVSKDLENNTEKSRNARNIPINGEENAFNFCPGHSGVFTKKNRDVKDSLILVLRPEKNPDLEKETQESNDDGLNNWMDKNEERIDCNQTREGGVDKQIEQERLDSSPMAQMEQSMNLNADYNQSTISLGKRNNSTLKCNEDQIAEKVQRTDNWSKQYETNYVFGPNQQNMPGSSTQNIDDECVMERCLPKDSTKKSKNSKPAGSNYIFTVNGTARDAPCSPKE